MKPSFDRDNSPFQNRGILEVSAFDASGTNLGGGLGNREDWIVVSDASIRCEPTQVRLRVKARESLSKQIVSLCLAIA